MKKSMIALFVLIFVFSNGCAFAEKKLAKDTQINYEQVTILDKGVKRTINMEIDSAIKNGYSTKQVIKKNGILVNFKNITDVTIADFEKKYGLRLKEKMIIGYYIFDNISKYSDVEIIQNIIADETNIKSVKPNWKMKNTPR